jgi:ATP-binding cassette subfamily B protein
LIATPFIPVKAADCVVVMDKGSIIEEGNLEDLLKQGGHYANLYNTYFRHQSPAYVEKAREMVEGD